MSHLHQCQNPTCGTSFTTRYSQPNRKYCSSACTGAHHRSRIDVACTNCGTLISKAPNELRDRKPFCSKACHDEWRRVHQRGENHHQYNRVQTTCEQCGKSTKRTPSQAAHAEHHFCSRACDNEWRRAHPLVGAANPRYTTITVQCAQCGADVQRQPWQANAYQSFCGRKCVNAYASAHRVAENGANWRGGHDGYRGPNWNRQRNAARKRDQYACQRCGKTERELGRELDVHHIKPLREFNYVYGLNENYKLANVLENLLSLCIPCHKAAERGD